MKKDEQEKALQAYLASGGELSNTALAKAVGVNPMTVGRWKSKDNWEKMLKDHKKAAKSSAKKTSKANEKKGLSKPLEKEMAKTLFIAAGGAISNAELAKTVDVSPVTIAKWKKIENWEADLDPIEPAPTSAHADNDNEHTIEYEEGEYEEIELPLALGSLDELLAPEQITLMNRKLQEHLNREHLSSQELAQLAEAKSDLLDSVSTCLNIIQDLRNFAF